MSDYSKLSFLSTLRVERIALKGSIGFSVAGGGFSNTTVTIPHNLGYRPYIKSFYTYGSGKYYDLWAGPGSYDIDGNATQISNADASTTSYVIFIENFGVPAISGTIYYRIYAEPQV